MNNKQKEYTRYGPFDELPEWIFDGNVESRNALQHCGRFHPYTCRDNDCRSSTDQAPLRAVESGWICDHCGLTQ